MCSTHIANARSKVMKKNTTVKKLRYKEVHKSLERYGEV
jgi:hypothetical protein